MKDSISTSSNIPVIAVISEVINLLPSEGIRKFSIKTAESIHDELHANVIKLGYEENELDNGKGTSFISKTLWLLRCRAKLKRIKPDAVIYIPSSPKLRMNLLKVMLWKQKKCKMGIIFLQPPEEKGFLTLKFFEIAGVLDDVKIFIQFEKSILPAMIRKYSTIFLPGGVDTDAFSPISQGDRNRLRKNMGICEEDRIILSVGHLKEERNLIFLMKIASKISAKIIFVCSPTKDNLELKRRLIESKIHVIDYYVDRIQDIYGISDCYLFPTIRRDAAIGIPLSILEALSMEIPVVTAHFGILQEIFKNQEGILFYKDEEEAIIQLRKALSMNRLQLRKMVIKWDWKSIASKILIDIGL